MKNFCDYKIKVIIFINAFISIFIGLAYAENWHTTFPAVFNITDLNGQNGFAINGIDAGDSSGDSVSRAGDVNGDGIDDILIGAAGFNNAVGQSYIIFGSKNPWASNFFLGTLNGDNGFAINGINQNDFSGLSVSGAGDINGDGIADILISALFYNNVGQSYVVFGSKTPWPQTVDVANLNGTNGFTVKGISDGGTAFPVSGAGDINGDKIDDLIIGNPFMSQSYVLFGSNMPWPAVYYLGNLDGDDGFTINGINQGDGSGYSVSGAGDINGDGIADIIIGALNEQSYVLFGSNKPWPAGFYLSLLNGRNGFTINGNNVAYSVSGAGDVNGDGIADIIIGAENDIKGIHQSYIVFGSKEPFPAEINLSDLNGIDGFAIHGINKGSPTGISVSGTGDVNGDGIADIIIGDGNANDGIGQSYIVFGSKKPFPAEINLSDLNGINGFTINGIIIAQHDYSGFPVSGAGDVNGDGVDDILIGDQDAGQSYVIFGNKTKP